MSTWIRFDVQNEEARIRIAGVDCQCFSCYQAIQEGEHYFQFGGGSPNLYHIHCAIEGGALVPFYDLQP